MKPFGEVPSLCTEILIHLYHLPFSCTCVLPMKPLREVPSPFTEILKNLRHLPFSCTYSHTPTHASNPLKPAPTTPKSSMKACRAQDATTTTTKTWHFRCSEAARAARSRRGPALRLSLLDLHALPGQALPAAVLVVVFLQSASFVSGLSIGGSSRKMSCRAPAAGFPNVGSIRALAMRDG